MPVKKWSLLVLAVLFLACQDVVSTAAPGENPPGGQQPPPGGEPPPPEPPGPPVPPPPPPPAGACEAQGSARCWYVDAGAASDGDGSESNPLRLPETAANRAGPGDFIYLHGTFGFDHAVPGSESERNGPLVLTGQANSGTADALITLKPWPGSEAVIQGDPAGQRNLSISIGGNYWRVEGLKVVGGYLYVAWYFRQNVHDVWVVGNEVCCAVAPDGNTGLLRVHAGPTSSGAPYNIYFQGNTVHDLSGCVSDATTPCTGATLAWNQDNDLEHHACFMIQNASGLVEFTDNELSHCAAAFYFKYEGPGPTFVLDNNIHDMRSLGRCRSAQKTFQGNTITGIERDPADQTSDRCESD